MTTAPSFTADSILPGPVRVDLGVLELAAARDAVLWHRRPTEYVVRTIIGVLIFATIAWRFDGSKDGAQVSLTFGLIALCIIPWTLQRALACVGKSSYTILALSPKRILARTTRDDVGADLDLLPIRIETKSLLVLSSAKGTNIIVLPKRVFPDPDTLARVRAIVLAPAESAASVEAARVFGDVLSVRFSVTWDELCALRRLNKPGISYGPWVTGAIVVVALGYVFYRQGPIFAAVSAGIFAVVSVMSRSDRRARALAGLADLTVEFDADMVRLITPAGVTQTFTWASTTRLLEDETILAFATKTGYVLLPKRVLPDSIVELIRSRVGR